jgi:3D (Asp-Asp-Asp) domain-containing protein
MKLLAAVFSMLVAVAEEFSLFKEESPAKKTEEVTSEWHLVAPSRTITKLEPQPAEEAFTVSASVYYPVPGQTDSTPFITADGSRINEKNPKKHRWIAVSRDLHSRWGGDISFGDSLRVTGLSDKLDGLYIVRDVMNQRIRNRIDILVGQHDNVMGYWKDVKVAKLN